MKEAFGIWPFWLRLALLDIQLRYRRTAIGPFWMTLSGLIFLFALGFVFSTLFGQNIEEYLPYVSAGLVIWWFMTTLILESCDALLGAREILLQRNIPTWFAAFRVTLRNAIVLGHNLLAFAVVVMIFPVDWSLTQLLFIPGVALIMLNGCWLAMVLGILCLRFRDLPQLVAVLTQVTIFITPVFWKRDMLPGWRVIIADANPLYHFLEICRGPLLGSVPSLTSYLVVFGVTVVGWCLAFLTFRRFRTVFAFWL